MTEYQRKVSNYLGQYVSCKKEFKQLCDEYNKLVAEFDGLGAQKITDMPINHGGFHSNPEENAIELVELEKEYRKRKNELIRICLKVNKMIKSIPCGDKKFNNQRMILHYRYIDGLSWEEICYRMGYSWGAVHKIHRKALDNIKL